MDVYVYGLVDPRDGLVKYVGKTKNKLKRRLADHLWEATSGKPGHKNRWIRKLQSNGLSPTIEVLEICDEANWQDRERHHIAIRSNLCNMTEGGEQCGATREVMERVWASNRGRCKSPESRRRTSAAMKGVPKTREHAAKVSRALKGRSDITRHGEDNKWAKLTDALVREIRLLSKSGASNSELASMFSVTPVNVWMIVTRKTWKHLPEG